MIAAWTVAVPLATTEARAWWRASRAASGPVIRVRRRVEASGPKYLRCSALSWWRYCWSFAGSMVEATGRRNS